jgi:hypothetical protein
MPPSSITLSFSYKLNGLIVNYTKKYQEIQVGNLLMFQNMRKRKYTILVKSYSIYIYIYYLEIYPFTTGETTTGVIVAASIRYKVIFTNDT